MRDLCVGHGGGRLCQQSGCSRVLGAPQTFALGTDLTRCRNAPFAVEMLAPPAHVAARRDEARGELNRLVPLYDWPVFGKANCSISTTVLSPMALNLEPFRLAAQVQLAQQQPLSPATSLAQVLEALQIQAGPETQIQRLHSGLRVGRQIPNECGLA